MKKRRILSLLLCMALVFATVANPLMAQAAEQTQYELSDYRNEKEYKAPTKSGYMFAGWYYDKEFKNYVDANDVDGPAYAKFVDPKVFEVKFQLRQGTTAVKKETDLRMITTVDSGNYYAIQFQVEIEGKKALLPVDTIYSTIYGYRNGENQLYEPSIFSATDSAFFAVQKVTDIPEVMFGKSITVTPVYETMDGTIITGVARTTVLKNDLPAVKSQKMDVVIFGGQSNMQGEGDTLNPEVVKGAYEYKYLSDSLVDLQNPVGENIRFDGSAGVDGAEVEEWLADHVTGAAIGGTTNLVPKFCEAYMRETDTQVTAVHVARGSTLISQWLPGTDGYNIIKDKTQAAFEAIEGAGYEIGHVYFAWLQGESDAIVGKTAEYYKEKLNELNDALQQDLGVEKFGVIRVGRFINNDQDWVIIGAQDDICQENEDFLMLTDIATELNDLSRYMSPDYAGHYSAAGLELLGQRSGKALGEFVSDGAISPVKDVDLFTRQETGVDLVIRTNIKDRLPYAADGSCVYQPYEAKGGSLLINGKKGNVSLVKQGEKEYIIKNLNPVDGMKIVMKGQFWDGTEANVIEFNRAVFVFDADLGANGTWVNVDSAYDVKVPVVDIATNGTAGNKLLVQTVEKDKQLFNGDWTCQYLAYEEGNGGIYIDGVKTNVPLIKIRNRDYYLYNISPSDGTIVKIEGQFYCKSDENRVEFKPTYFIYDANIGESGMWKDYVVPSETINTSIADSATTGEALHFETGTNDTLAYAEDNSISYAPIHGGVYVDGFLNDSLSLTKYGVNKYSVSGITPVAGMEVKIQGTFGTAEKAIIVGPATFVYNGNGNWVMYTAEATTTSWADHYDFGTSILRLCPSKMLMLDAYAGTEVAALYGGLYVNGGTTPLNLPMYVHDGANVWYNTMPTAMPENGYIIEQGTILRLDAVYGNATYGVRITGDFIFNGTDWVSYIPGGYSDIATAISYADNHSDFKTAILRLAPSKELSLAAGDHVAITGGLYVNDAATAINMPLTVYDGASMWYGTMPDLLVANGYTVEAGMTIKLDAVYGTNLYAVRITGDFKFDGSTWKSYTPVKYDFVADYYARPNRDGFKDSTISLLSDAIETNIKTAGWFKPIDGGIYVNGTGEAIKVPLHREVVGGYPGLSYFYNGGTAVGYRLPDFGIEVREGLMLLVDGVYNQGTTSFKVNDLKLIYMDGKWLSYTDEATATSYGDTYDFVTPILRLCPSKMIGLSAGDHEAISGGLYVNGATTAINMPLTVLDGANMYYGTMEATLKANGYTIEKGMVVELDTIYQEGTYVVRITGTFRYDGSEWLSYTPAETMDEATAISYGDGYSFVTPILRLCPSKVLSLSAGNHEAISGGLYVNGAITAINMPLTVHDGANMWYNTMPDLLVANGYTVEEGMIIKLDATYQEGTYAVRITGTFRYDGSTWRAYTDEATATSYGDAYEFVTPILRLCPSKMIGLSAGDHEAVSGGLYVNGSTTEINMPLTVFDGANMWYNTMPDLLVANGYTVEEGMIIELDAIYKEGDYRVRITGTFRYDGSTWRAYAE